jgi:hypothetical protein
MGRGIQPALTDDGNGKKNSSNCTAPTGRGILRVPTEGANASEYRNSNSAYRRQQRQEEEEFKQRTVRPTSTGIQRGLTEDGNSNRKRNSNSA